MSDNEALNSAKIWLSYKEEDETVAATADTVTVKVRPAHIRFTSLDQWLTSRLTSDTFQTTAPRKSYDISISIGHDPVSSQATHDALPSFVKDSWRRAFTTSVQDDICYKRTGPRRVVHPSGFTVTYLVPGLAQSTFDDEMLDDAKIWLSFKNEEPVVMSSASETELAVPSEVMIAPPSPALSEATCIGEELDVDSSNAKVAELVEESRPAVVAPTRRQGLYKHFFGSGSTTTNYPLVAELVNGHGVAQKGEVVEVEVAEDIDAEVKEVGVSSQEALHKNFFGGSTSTHYPLVSELSTCVLDVTSSGLPLTPPPTPTFSQQRSAMQLDGLALQNKLALLSHLFETLLI